MKPPLLDSRTRDDVRRQALELAGFNPPAGWTGYVPDWANATDGHDDDPGRRLVDVFSRLMELLIERVNRVPEKNFLAFLDLAGVERFPGAPAEVPVTFLLAKGAALGGVVPAGTQVATVQTKTTNARVFETRRSFFATRAKLERMIALDPGTDRYVEMPVVAAPKSAEDLATIAPVEVFGSTAAMTDVPHVLYVASEALFARSDAVNVSVTIQFLGPAFPTTVTWRRFDDNAGEWVSLPVFSVSSGTGQVIFTFALLPPTGKATVRGIEDHWLAASFDDAFPVAGLPLITAITGAVSVPAPPAAPIDAAFHNAAKLDVSKPFLPFGSRPVYADAFHLGSRTGFAPGNASAAVTLTIRPYTNASLIAQFAGVSPSQTIRTIAKWQYLGAGGTWTDVPGSAFDHQITINAGATLTVARAGGTQGEGTLHGTADGDDTITIALPALPNIGLHELNGVESRWIRMLLVSDKPYGSDGVLVTGVSTTTPSVPTAKFVGPLLIPPRVESAVITYQPGASAIPVSRVLTFNDFGWQEHATPLAGLVPFSSVDAFAPSGIAAYGAAPALYLAFDRPFEPAAFVSLFVDRAAPASALTSPLEGGKPDIAWEYRTASGWQPLDAGDETLDLTTSGIVAFPAPADAVPTTLFEQLAPDAAADVRPRWWIRGRLASGVFDHPPRVSGVYFNSVMADQQTTVAELPVGSSNGEPQQEFVLVKAPMLAGELWVREADRPTAAELTELQREHEEDGSLTAVLDVRAAEGVEPDIWVRWRRMSNFEQSHARSRHYLVDLVAARVIFGGGDTGLIPPPLRDNLVLRGFRTGGGGGANAETPPLAIKELKTSLPFIDRVLNVAAAAGGASEWSIPQLLSFGPESLKTRGRAVTAEDYEWMILQRFSGVARARCIPVREPAPGGVLAFKPGAVTTLLVPWSTDPRPQPSQGLLRKVQAYVQTIVLANITRDVHVMGPRYEVVRVVARIVPSAPELGSVVLRQAQAALEAFLHPLTGGEHGEGYAFGRDIYLSEVHAVLSRIEGVDHVESAGFADRAGDVYAIAGDQLASSGAHLLTIVGGEA